MLKYVTVIFDRKKKIGKIGKNGKNGKGKVELQVKLADGKRKYVGLFDVDSSKWPSIQEDPVVKAEAEKYERIRVAMEMLGEPITIESLNKHLGIEPKSGAGETLASQKESDAPASTKTETEKPAGRKKAKVKKEKDTETNKDSNANFLDFMIECINKEKQAYGTLQKKSTVIDALRRFKRIKKMSDLTPENIRRFDEWLHSTGERTNVTVYSYHKWLRKYARRAYQQGYIERTPYDLFTIPRGKSKERQPLTEEELNRLLAIELPSKEAKARDLFIFAAYTGLSYCDMQAFDFKTMTEKHGDLYYIDGSRLKTDTKFFTPILPPAMKVLIKYNFQLPRESNQKINDYLHLVESRMNLNKPLTYHVARHTFATLSLANDVPIENVSRMLGHTNIRTTQIYAKVLKENVERHAETLCQKLFGS